jgi:hypothetical protein
MHIFPVSGRKNTQIHHSIPNRRRAMVHTQVFTRFQRNDSGNQYVDSLSQLWIAQWAVDFDDCDPCHGGNGA